MVSTIAGPRVKMAQALSEEEFHRMQVLINAIASNKHEALFISFVLQSRFCFRSNSQIS